MLRLIAFPMLMAAGAAVAAPPAGSSVSSAAERQLDEARAQVETQHAKTAQLKSRVSELEQLSAAQRARQAQQDREIAELQRKLEAASNHTAPAPRSGGDR